MGKRGGAPGSAADDSAGFAAFCAADFRHWVPDVCRHTFATYHAAKFRNLPELQLEMGHRDTALLRSRYMMPASRRSAELFWKGCV